MPYLIDGNNFIGHSRYLKLDDSRSKHILVSQLLIFKQFKKTKIILVFDGPPDPSMKEKTAAVHSFRILNPPIGENADTLIKEIISQQKDLKKFYVVSSDREIKGFAGGQGAKVLSCLEFSRKLHKTLKKNSQTQDKQKRESPLSPLEVNHWIEIFKQKK